MQGSFGCVFRPSLHCKNPITVHYGNYVSKLMKNTNALKEIGNFLLIRKEVGKNKTLGTNNNIHQCIIPDLSPQVKQTIIQNCGYKTFHEVESHPTNYSLLLTVDSGIDLQLLVQQTALLKSIQTTPFLNQIRNLIEAVDLLQTHGLCHADIHFKNIVYSPTHKTLKLIDFGDVQTFQVIENLTTRSKYPYAFWNWQTPIERKFMNKTSFQADSTPTKLQQFIHETLSNTYYTTHSNTAPVMNVPSIYYRMVLNNTGGKETMQSALASFAQGWTEFKQKHSFNSFIHIIERSLDLYGIAIAFYQILYTLPHQTNQLKQIQTLFQQALHPNIMLRTLSIKEILNNFPKTPKTSPIKSKHKTKSKHKHKKTKSKHKKTQKNKKK